MSLNRMKIKVSRGGGGGGGGWNCNFLIGRNSELCTPVKAHQLQKK